ncbi:MAG: hypothetical protein AM324_012085 [Candidatus Thorarchaeota archaeon SMTZ1-83]|nr:MAG: hypothetical protein AM324_13300 [Candidatus Thorarchaeota archaeon SMTZ1-83]
MLFVLNKHTGLSPYSHEFVIGGIDPQLLSGFVTAMGSFLAEVVGSEETGWKTVYGSDTTFIVEMNDWVVGVLAVARETTELRSRLRRVVREFKQSFEVLKDSDGIDGGLFAEFDQFVMKTLTLDKVAPQSLVTRRNGWEASLDRMEHSDSKTLARDLVAGLEVSMTVSKLVETHSQSLKGIRDSIAEACWHNAAYVKYVPTEHDILEISERALSIMLDSSNPLGLSTMTIAVIGRLDGRTTLENFIGELSQDDKDRVLQELGNLILSGHIHRISMERESVLVNECILTRFAGACSEVLGAEEIQQTVSIILASGVANHPWLSRVRVQDDLSLQSVLDEAMTPRDFDLLAEALEQFLNDIVDALSEVMERNDVIDLLKYARWSCQEDWIPGLTEAVL